MLLRAQGVAPAKAEAPSKPVTPVAPVKEIKTEIPQIETQNTDIESETKIRGRHF